ncbi:MAG: TIGR01906 family membrane protein [Candidatus Izimaplasma sp.]|nr:TIGR01906 family membrane protein [Candidatus Izimaplasma bacterium]
MKIIRIIINILIPFFLLILFASLLTTRPYLQLSKGLYESHDDVYFDHDYAIERIAGYLNYRYDNLEFGLDELDDNTIMRDTEISHMVDVKNLYTTLKISAIISLVIAVSLSYVMYKRDYEELYKTFKNIYFGPMFFVMFLGVSFAVNFDKAFTIFHKLFFTNDDWILYSTDVLIILLPQVFWLISGVIILVLFSISLGAIYYVNERIHFKHS